MLVNTPYFFNLYNVPPFFVNSPYNKSLSPIALITNGLPTFSPFICITFPAQLILVELTILFPFIEIASAPATFNSFIIATKLPSWTK